MNDFEWFFYHNKKFKNYKVFLLILIYEFFCEKFTTENNLLVGATAVYTQHVYMYNIN